MISKIILSIFTIVCLITLLEAQNPGSFRNRTSSLEMNILHSIFITGNYDSTIRPQGNGGPTAVRINMYVRSISNIDAVNMEYSCQITFRQVWKDERLEFDSNQGKLKYITLDKPDRIWTPDLFFSNEKEGNMHSIIKPNVLLRVHPNGDVLYSTRISLKLHCPMDLKKFPFDSQMCSVVTASYGYTEEDVVLLWKSESPVQMTKNLHLRTLKLDRFMTDYCTSKTNTGQYSCIKLDMLFSREFKHYLIHVYIPCTMFTVVSWVQFWLDYKAVTGRVVLGITTLLAFAMQISWMNSSFPIVSYTKAVDVWTGVCITFVFAALLVTATANYCYRFWKNDSGEKKNGNGEKRNGIEKIADIEAEKLDDDPNSYGMKALDSDANGTMKSNTRQYEGKMPEVFERCLNHFPWCARCLPTCSRKIDVISRICFPSLFILFNICYWAAYLTSNE